MNLAREDMERVGARKETKSTGRSGKYFRAVATPNRKKPKEEEEEEVRDDDGLDQIFLVRGPQSSRGHYFIYPSHRV